MGRFSITVTKQSSAARSTLHQSLNCFFEDFLLLWTWNHYCAESVFITFCLCFLLPTDPLLDSCDLRFRRLTTSIELLQWVQRALMWPGTKHCFIFLCILYFCMLFFSTFAFNYIIFLFYPKKYTFCSLLFYIKCLLFTVNKFIKEN